VPRAITLLVTLLLLGACTPASSDEEPVLLRVAMADDWASAPAVTDVIAAFEDEYPHVRVEVQDSPFSQIPDLVRSGQELDHPYDLAHWHAFAAAGAEMAQPVDHLWERYGLEPDEYLPGALQSVTWQDRRYGVPLDTNALVMMVRPDVLAEAGLTPEDLTDAERMVEIARHVDEAGVVAHPALVGASSWVAYGYIRAFGGELVEVEETTGEPRFTFDDERTIAALEARTALVEEGLAPSPFAPDLASEGVQLFARGELAIFSGGSWDLPTMARADVDVDDIAVLPLPRGQGDTGTVLGGSSLFVPEGAEHPELAFELALRLTDDEVALRLVEEEGRLPARTRLLEHESLQAAPDLAAFVAELPEADVMPLIAYPEVAEAFREALENTLAGRQEVAEAMRDVQRFAEEWQERRG
jgi:multiple sugar transport system substrate-binding protein